MQLSTRSAHHQSRRLLHPNGKYSFVEKLPEPASVTRKVTPKVLARTPLYEPKDLEIP